MAATENDDTSGRGPRAILPTRLVRPGEPFDEDVEDAAFYASLAPEERLREVFRLSEETWEWVEAGRAATRPDER